MTPGRYHGPPHHMPPGEGPHRGMYHPPPSNRAPSSGRKAPPKDPPAAPKDMKNPSVVTPKTPAVRIKFDPATSRKKRQVTSREEPTLPYFGTRAPEQPKTAALAIFSFLSNDDLYHAGLVCKRWSELAMDNELWKFQAV